MANDQLIGRTLDGRYRIEALVARGGMATVYVASDLRLRRNVAIKVMHASLAEDHEFVHRFEREARAAAQLANPHVVAVHDQGHDAETGAIYLVMEYVVGRTVREIMAARGALTEVQALAVLDPVLQALAAAHDAGFVHRDVKPENVLVGDDGRIKVTDFGLARAIAASSLSAATQGVLIGTVAYLSPEQVERGYADARSDVYGAGVLLYEMLTGEVPHSGETPLAIAFQHVHADVAAPSTIHSGISPAVDDVVVRATRRDPQQRFQDAREFLAAVRSARSLIDPQYVAGPMPTPDHAGVERDSLVHASKRRRRLPRRLALMSLAAIGIAAAGWWLTVGTHSTVPEVIGIPVSDAQASLKAVSLGSTVEKTWNKSVPEGSVVDAQPLPGTSVTHGTRVLLLVSKGPERYEVPQLVGLDVGDAKDALAAVKLRLGTTTQAYDESVSAGIIVSTNPEPGLVARPGDVVDIVVSKGPAPIPVPSVAGLSLNAADAALRAAGFATTSATSYDDRVATGIVMRTEPGSGAALQRGSHVKIVVSKGPAPVRVPDVFRMTQSKAEAALKAVGLKVKVVKSSGRLLNLVKSQSPSAGSVVPRGTTVTITIV